MEEKLPFAGDIVRTTSVRRLNKLYFTYTDLSPEVQQAYKDLIPYFGGVEDLLQAVSYTHLTLPTICSV